MKVKNIVTIALFLSLLILPTLIYPFVKDYIHTDIDENREPSPFPEFSSHFFADLETYYNDRLPFRDFIVSAYSDFEADSAMLYNDLLSKYVFHSGPINPNDDKDDTIDMDDDVIAPDLDDDIDDDPPQTAAPSTSVPTDEPQTGVPDTSQEPDTQTPQTSVPDTPQTSQPDDEPDDPQTSGPQDSDEPEEPDEPDEPEEPQTPDDPYEGLTTIERIKKMAQYPGGLVSYAGLFGLDNEDFIHSDNSDYTKNGFRYYGLYDSSIAGRPLVASVVNGVILGKSDWLFYEGEYGNSLNDYIGTNMSTTEMRSVVSALNNLDAVLQKSGQQLIFIIGPNKENVYDAYMPTSYRTVSGVKRARALVNYCNSNCDNIICIYPEDVLEEYAKTYQVYYKTDTHWNSAGGYIAVQEILGALELPTTPLYNVSAQRVGATKFPEGNSTGDLSSMSGRTNIADYDYNINYLPAARVTQTTLKDNRGNGYEIEFDVLAKSSNPLTNKNCVVVGDSFRMAMNPFLFKAFAQTVSFHNKYIENADVRQYIKSADVIVFENVERLANLDTQFNINMNSNLVTQLNRLRAVLEG